MRLDYTFSNLCGTVYRQGNLVFSADGNCLYAAVGNRVSCYDLVRSRTFTFPFEARRNISQLALSPDGVTMVTADEEGGLLLVNVHRRVVVAHLNLKQPISAMRFSPDGAYIAFGLGRFVQLWATPCLARSFTPFALHRTYGGHIDDVTCLCWSPDGLFIASGGADLSVRVHSLHTLPGYSPANLSGHRSAVRAVFFGPDGETIYAVARDGALSVWRTADRPDADRAAVARDRAAAIAAGGPGRGEHRLGRWWTLEGRHYFDKDRARVSSAAYDRRTGLLVVGFTSGVFALYELPDFNEARDAAEIPPRWSAELRAPGCAHGAHARAYFTSRAHTPS